MAFMMYFRAGGVTSYYLITCLYVMRGRGWFGAGEGVVRLGSF